MDFHGKLEASNLPYSTDDARGNRFSPAMRLLRLLYNNSHGTQDCFSPETTLH